MKNGQEDEGNENDLLAGTKTMLGSALLLSTYASSEANWI